MYCHQNLQIYVFFEMRNAFEMEKKHFALN